MTVRGQQEWFTAAELAQLGLSGLLPAANKIRQQAMQEGWAGTRLPDGQCAVRKTGRAGGGFEYHFSVLPACARAEMASRGMLTNPATMAEPAANDPDSPWAAWEAATEVAREKARERLRALVQFDAQLRAIGNVQLAINAVSAETGIGRSTLFAWRAKVQGVPARDRLPLLLPEYKGVGRKAELGDDVFLFYKSLRLRRSMPTHADCFRRTVEWAEKNGHPLTASGKTFDRRYKQEVPREVQILAREGADGMKRLVPAQERSILDLNVMEVVNIDGHTADVYVRFPAGGFQLREEVDRPVLVTIQDVRSRKILAWRIGRSESAMQIRLAFATLFQTWGIPRASLMDNGRGNASKWISGGAPTRFRFKIREDEPDGVLTSLGIDIKWALPYHGQAKPIERAFRDFAQEMWRHPAFDGCWAGDGKKVKNGWKPGKPAVDLAQFIAVVETEIARHNARTGRRGKGLNGRSFDEVFAEGYASGRIRKACAEDLRLALLSADQVRANRDTGAISFLNNRYWCAELGAVAGQLVTIRFDPDSLHGDIHVYDERGRFVATAPNWGQQGFESHEAAQQTARLVSTHRKATRKALEAEELLSSQHLARELAALSAPETAAPEATVVEPVRPRRSRGSAAPLVAASSFDREEYQRRTSAALETQLRLVRDQE